MKTKRIKASERGLTFSLSEEDATIGAKYRYVVDVKKKEVNIIYDKNGDLRVSKKKSGDKLKPLFDLRSKEVKEAIANADYLEIEIQEDQIIVYSRKKKAGKICKFSDHLVKLEQLLGQRTGKIVIPMQMAAGGECYQYTIDDYLSEIINATASYTAISEKIISDVQKIYNVVSLFSGAGLFDKAWLDDGRFHIVYANDYEKNVIETYQKNIGKHIVCKDIRDIAPSEIPDADVTIGGICCQAYSNANRHNMDSEEAEEKRLLIDDYAKLVKTNVWVVENVPTILTKEQGYYFDRLCNALSDYEITATVVTDCEVGGFSKRQRAIIIGSKIGKISLPELKVLTPKTVRDALRNVDATWFNFSDVTLPGKETERKMSFVPEGGNWKDIPKPYNTYGPKTHSNVMRRLSWDSPSITLSNFRKSNILHPSENRILNVSEAAAIMGLDKDFKFYGGLSAKQQMVSNGVTQAIGKLVKSTVLKKLDAYYSGNTLCTASI